MLLKTTLRSRLLAGIVALAACGDFTLVDPRPEGPLLSVNVSALGEGETTRYELHALFYPGKDGRGEPTQVTDRALYVEGTAVLPESETRADMWSYRWRQTKATGGAGADSIRVTFPVIANSAPGTYSIAIPVTRRENPGDVDLTRGEDLVLRVSSAAGPPPPELPGGADFWTLEIRQRCSEGVPHFSLMGRGPHPSELRVPWQWLEAVPVGTTSACFHVFSGFKVVGSPYPATAAVSAHLVWRINMSGGTTP